MGTVKVGRRLVHAVPLHGGSLNKVAARHPQGERGPADIHGVR